MLASKTIIQHYMPEIYEQVKSNVTEAMKRGLVYFSLTTDMLGRLELITVT